MPQTLFEGFVTILMVVLAGTSISYGQIRTDTRLWEVLTEETLPPRQVSFSTSYDRMHRSPGDLTIGTFELGVSVGITGRLEGEVRFEAYRHVRVGQGAQLSFGQQQLGFFGDKTPGSPPLPSELMPESSRVPQLRFPASSGGALTGTAGYYNLLPFAGLVEAGGASGLVSLGAKYKILSEGAGAPLGLALRSYFSIPVHKGIDFLLTHPIGTADLQFGFDAIASKTIGYAQLHWNAGYRHISQPAHASVFRLADDLPMGLGLVIPRAGRVRFIAESTADVFIGTHTPNTSLGEHPVDITAGIRTEVTPSLSVSAGYRRPVNPRGENRNGFVATVSYTTAMSGNLTR